MPPDNVSTWRIARSVSGGGTGFGVSFTRSPAGRATVPVEAGAPYASFTTSYASFGKKSSITRNVAPGAAVASSTRSTRMPGPSSTRPWRGR